MSTNWERLGHKIIFFYSRKKSQQYKLQLSRIIYIIQIGEMISQLCLLFDERILSGLDILVAEIQAVCPGTPSKNGLEPHPEDEEMLKEDPFFKEGQYSTAVSLPPSQIHSNPNETQDLPTQPPQLTPSQITEDENNSSSSEGYSNDPPETHQWGRSNRARRQVNPYPTKNFLQTFRGFFLRYLRKFFSPAAFNSFGIIQRILSKKGINLKDFQALLNTDAFRPHLERYFDEGRIYHDLETSRVKPNVKKHYEKRAYVFEKGFRTGQFRKINESTNIRD